MEMHSFRKGERWTEVKAGPMSLRVPKANVGITLLVVAGLFVGTGGIYGSCAFS